MRRLGRYDDSWSHWKAPALFLFAFYHFHNTRPARTHCLTARTSHPPYANPASHSFVCAQTNPRPLNYVTSASSLPIKSLVDTHTLKSIFTPSLYSCNWYLGSTKASGRYTSLARHITTYKTTYVRNVTRIGRRATEHL